MSREGRILTLLPFKNGSGAAMSSSPWEEALGEGDGDVAAPVWDGELGRGGDVIIAVGRGFGKWRRGRRHPGLGWGTGNGEAMSSSPWEGALGKGDEDVATPFHVGAGSGG
jgi:hypothetical protein